MVLPFIIYISNFNQKKHSRSDLGRIMYMLFFFLNPQNKVSLISCMGVLKSCEEDTLQAHLFSFFLKKKKKDDNQPFAPYSLYHITVLKLCSIINKNS